jgi:very-short-patch-repair endonuclease
VGRLRELIDSWDQTIERSRSNLELEFVRLCRRASIPEPEVNSRLAGYEVDMLWRSQRLAVEVDGYGFHQNRQEFEKDRARDADLTLAGFRVLRFTDRKILYEPEFVASRLRGALGLSDS